MARTITWRFHLYIFVKGKYLGITLMAMLLLLIKTNIRMNRLYGSKRCSKVMAWIIDSVDPKIVFVAIFVPRISMSSCN